MLSQIFAVSIFLGMFVCIVSGKIPRHITTTAAALLTIVLVFPPARRNGLRHCEPPALLP